MVECGGTNSLEAHEQQVLDPACPQLKASPAFMCKIQKLMADEGNSDAQYKAAGCYAVGHGVEKNATRAFEYFMMAAEHGHTQALYQVASHYEHGSGVKADKNKALEYYKLAAMKGHSMALYQYELVTEELGLYNASDPLFALYPAPSRFNMKEIFTDSIDARWKMHLYVLFLVFVVLFVALRFVWCGRNKRKR